MKLKIRDEGEVEEVCEFWLVFCGDDLEVRSKKGGLNLCEFTILSNGNWYKSSGGHLENKSK